MTNDPCAGLYRLTIDESVDIEWSNKEIEAYIAEQQERLDHLREG